MLAALRPPPWLARPHCSLMRLLAPLFAPLRRAAQASRTGRRWWCWGCCWAAPSSAPASSGSRRWRAYRCPGGRGIGGCGGGRGLRRERPCFVEGLLWRGAPWLLLCGRAQRREAQPAGAGAWSGPGSMKLSLSPSPFLCPPACRCCQQLVHSRNRAPTQCSKQSCQGKLAPQPLCWLPPALPPNPLPVRPQFEHLKGAGARKTLLLVGVMAAHALGEGCGVGVSFVGDHAWSQVGGWGGCGCGCVCGGLSYSESYLESSRIQ